MDKPNLELILVVVMMVLIFLFGLVVVFVFLRTWRREQKAKRTHDDIAEEPPNN